MRSVFEARRPAVDDIAGRHCNMRGVRPIGEGDCGVFKVRHKTVQRFLALQIGRVSHFENLFRPFSAEPVRSRHL